MLPPATGRRLALAGALVVALCAPILAGCGDSSSEAEARDPIEVPGRPAAADCGFRAGAAPTGAVAKKTKSPPTPGAYVYRVAGVQVVPGAGVRARDLPPRGELFITPARRWHGLVCFSTQRRFSADVANTSTYVIRGREVYLVGLLIEALGETHAIRPDPPVLTVSDKGSSWSGRFAGSTYGTYAFTALGERTLRVGSKPLRVVGVSSQVSYRGTVAGTQQSTVWISPRREVVVSESFSSRQRLGVNALRLRSRSHLLSTKPKPLPEDG